jgi:hypothetical protein
MSSRRNDSNGRGFAPVRTVEKQPLGVDLTLAAAAEVIRTLVNNRVDNERIRPPVANQCRRSRLACEAVLPLWLITVLTVAAHQPCHRCGREGIGSTGEPANSSIW